MSSKRITWEVKKIGARKISVNNLKDEKIIAVSDVHLGYNECNKNEFNSFINNIDENNCNRLVICGDFLDMWRRETVGVVLENIDKLNKQLLNTVNKEDGKQISLDKPNIE